MAVRCHDCSIILNVHSTMVMNDEKMWKNVTVVYFKVISHYMLRENEENTEVLRQDNRSHAKFTISLI
jgi:hypothetical protein